MNKQLSIKNGWYVFCVALLIVCPYTQASHRRRLTHNDHYVPEPQKPDMAFDRQGGNYYIERKDFIKLVLGYSEDDLRQELQQKPKQRNMTTLFEQLKSGQNNRWIQQYSHRAAIFAGTRTLYSLDSLKNENTRKQSLLGSKENNKPRFALRLYDPSQPEKSDIRSLVSDPANKGATFQSASALNGFEGRTAQEKINLDDMLGSPTQGEELAISTVGRSLWMKYFSGISFDLLPSFVTMPWWFHRWPFYYLSPFFNSNNSGVNVPSWQDVMHNNYANNPYLKNCTKVIACKDEVVVLGNTVQIYFSKIDHYYGKADKKVKNLYQKVVDVTVNNSNNTVDRDKSQIVNVVTTSAYSLQKYFKDSNKNKEGHYQKKGHHQRKKSNQNRQMGDPYCNIDAAVSNFCKTLLKAAYEGSLRAAIAMNSQKVFLTMVGAGSYRNNVQWIGEAIATDTNKELIKTHGLDVTLLYRPDTSKAPFRSFDGDARFICGLLPFMDSINGTRNDNEDIRKRVKNYIAQMYGCEEQRDIDENEKKELESKDLFQVYFDEKNKIKELQDILEPRVES